MLLKLIMICIAFFPFAQTAQVYAFSPRDNCLWIEYGVRVREKDGTLTLPLEIKYGVFPGKEQGARDLRDLRVFYGSDGEDPGKRVYYHEVSVEEAGRVYRARIRLSDRVNRFTVRAQARRDEYGVTYRYCAKTSFLLFGRFSSGKNKSRGILPNEVARRLEITLTPEFHYWPEVGNPVTIASVFDNSPRPYNTIYLFDENGVSVELHADKTGSCRYLPPEDAKLNRKGEPAFKQTVMVAQEESGGIKYISSYTLLLHRSRFKNYRLFPGVVVFLGTAVGVSFLIMSRRKRFDLEYQ